MNSKVRSCYPAGDSGWRQWVYDLSLLTTEERAAAVSATFEAETRKFHELLGKIQESVVSAEVKASDRKLKNHWKYVVRTDGDCHPVIKMLGLIDPEATFENGNPVTFWVVTKLDAKTLNELPGIKDAVISSGDSI